MIHPTDFDSSGVAVVENQPAGTGTAAVASGSSAVRRWKRLAFFSTALGGFAFVLWLGDASKLRKALEDKRQLAVQIDTMRIDRNSAYEQLASMRSQAASIRDRLVSVGDVAFTIDRVDVFSVVNDLKSAEPSDTFAYGVDGIHFDFQGANPLNHVQDLTATLQISVLEPNGEPLTFGESTKVTQPIQCSITEPTCSVTWGFRMTGAPLTRGRWQVVIERNGRRIGGKTFEVQ